MHAAPALSSSLDRASDSHPRYSIVARALLDRIVAGSYPVGSLLPTELELCKQFGVSRTTLREATRWLRDRGMVSGKAGVGTVVLSSKPVSRFVHAIESLSDVFQYTKDSRNPVVLSAQERDADLADAELLRCAPGQRWMRIELTRSFVSDDSPILFARIYVPSAYAGIAPLVSTRSEPVYTLLESVYGERMLGLEQEFKSVRIGARHARILQTSTGAPGLSVIRHYFGSGERLMLVTASLYRSDRYSFRMRLSFNPRTG